MNDAPMTGDSATYSGGSGTRLMEHASEFAGKAGQKLADIKQAGMDKASQLQSSTTDLVRQNPIMSVVVGLGIGLLVGRLLTRRN